MPARHPSHEVASLLEGASPCRPAGAAYAGRIGLPSRLGSNQGRPPPVRAGLERVERPAARAREISGADRQVWPGRLHATYACARGKLRRAPVGRAPRAAGTAAVGPPSPESGSDSPGRAPSSGVAPDGLVLRAERADFRPTPLLPGNDRSASSRTRECRPETSVCCAARDRQTGALTRHGSGGAGVPASPRRHQTALIRTFRASEGQSSADRVVGCRPARRYIVPGQQAIGGGVGGIPGVDGAAGCLRASRRGVCAGREPSRGRPASFLGAYRACARDPRYSERQRRGSTACRGSLLATQRRTLAASVRSTS